MVLSHSDHLEKDYLVGPLDNELYNRIALLPDGEKKERARQLYARIRTADWDGYRHGGSYFVPETGQPDACFFGYQLFQEAQELREELERLLYA